jgi:hypothetical protein
MVFQGRGKRKEGGGSDLDAGVRPRGGGSDLKVRSPEGSRAKRARARDRSGILFFRPPAVCRLEFAE